MNKPYEQPFVLGMDGGGTKTKVCAATLQGQIFDELTGGSMNINSQGQQGVRQNMAEIFSRLADRGATWQQLRSLCMGAAGISNPLTRETLEQSVQEAGIGVRTVIIGDHQAALYGAHGKGQGMILIAGTGSICYGLDGKGAEARSGGWGHLIDDEGSGYALGRDVLAAVVQAEDGRIPPTCMRQSVMQQLGISSIPELIRFVYSPATGKKEIAALAPIVMEGVAAGEEAADRILDKAARCLADLASAVIRKLHMEEGSLAFCGSVITRNEVLIQKLKDILASLYPGLRCIRPENDAAVGAVLRSLEEI